MKLLLLITTFFISTAIFSQRRSGNFDENWKFHFGHAADPAKDFNYGISSIFAKSGKTDNTALAMDFNDSAWRDLNLPHDWAVELPFVHSSSFDVQSHGYKPVGGLFPETSIGWYRKHFTLPSKDSGQRFQLQFDGVFRDAEFWLNGFYLGNNKSGYVGIAFDITDYIQFNRNNVLTVRVDATQYEGWFYEGAGIYRHVWLNQFPNTHIVHDGVFAFSTLKGNHVMVEINTEVENQGLRDATVSVQTFIADREGKINKASPLQQLRLNAGKQSLVTQKIEVQNPRLWSLEDPYLYRVVSLVKQNGKTIDSISHRFGIRNIEIKPNGVFLNGKHVKLKGTNNHQDHAGLGSALPDYMQYYRIQLLKDMGCNAYRASHHAPTPELLDACDSLGMLVMDEQRLVNSSKEYMDQFERLIRRDRNHPSVFMWSIGNEEGWIQTNHTGRRIAQTMLQKQRALDPSRTSTYAADVANVFEGINEVIPVRGFNYRQFGVADYHRDHPHQPIIGTEMGSTVTTRGMYYVDSVKAYLPDQDISFPWWASRAETWWKLAAENDFWLGGFIWTGFDYRGEPTPFQWPNISSHFGVMDVCGFPKNIYYYYQSWWTGKDVLHISPHWNRPMVKEGAVKDGTPVDVWVNTNAEDVELFLNGKSLGKKQMPRNGHLQWQVNYAPGTLEAIANKKGRILRKKIETTGAPFEVVVTPYKTTFYADGKDVSVINISVVDRQGREVPDANNLISFSVKGDAKILGVGNGDPSSHERDRYDDTAAVRKLFNGKCQVILQAGTTPSQIRFEAKAEGLWTGSTDIFSIHAGNVQTKLPARPPRKNIKIIPEKILGADISFLPELEAKGVKFSDKGVEKDAITILKEHGMNYVRLRIFNEPANDSGYSPGKGFCDLEHTKAMAKRVKAAGMKLLLDFHYSDYWADPGKQYKPASWKEAGFDQLKDSIYNFTRRVMMELKEQGTVPDMVQVGNEINHGILWPEGHVNHLDSLAELLMIASRAVVNVHPQTILLLHVALGGQRDEAKFFIDAMQNRGVPFDVIGLSYYPKWHGTLDDLENSLAELSDRYHRDILVVEYSQRKREVNEAVFRLENGRGKGSFIWEPLNTWEAVFNRDGKSNEYLEVYDELKKEFLKN